MKSVLVALLVSLAAASELPGHGHEPHDNGQFRLLQYIEDADDASVIQCLLSDDNKGCTEAWHELKSKLFSVVVATDCATCKVEERSFLLNYLRGFFRRNPQWGPLIQHHYDPTHLYRDLFGKVWTNMGIPVY